MLSWQAPIQSPITAFPARNESPTRWEFSKPVHHLLWMHHSPIMDTWKLVSLSFRCSGMIPKLFLTTTLYIPLSLLVIGLNWSVVCPPSLLLYWVWARPSGKTRPSWYHVTVVFSRNRLWNSTVKVKGRLPVISWNGGGWEVMAGETGGGCWEGREEQKAEEQREDRVESRKEGEMR